jgi:hypothetical protein
MKQGQKDFARQFLAALIHITDPKNEADKISLQFNTTPQMLDSIIESKFFMYVNKELGEFIISIRKLLFNKVSEHGGLQGIENIVCPIDVCFNQKLNKNTIVIVEDTAVAPDNMTVEIGTMDDDDEVDAVVEMNSNVIDMFGDKRDGELN